MSSRGRSNYVVSLISGLGIIFCFFLFPFFVIETSLKSLSELQTQNRRQSIFTSLAQRNELISSFDDERKYYEKLLRNIFNIAQKQGNSLGYLERSIKLLKKNYPDQLEFVVWNEKGLLVEKLTDEKRYRYVLKKLYLVLKEVSQSILSESSTPIKNLESVKNNLNIIKQFLGRVFLPETLRQPYNQEGHSSLILADYGKDRPYFWYQIGKNFSMLVFINWGLIEGNQGLTKLCKAINAKWPDSFCGFAHIRDLTQIYPEPKARFANEIVAGLARFETVAEQEIELANSLMSVQLLNPKIRIFNIQKKDKRLLNTSDHRLQLLTKLGVLYFIGLAVVILNFRFRNAFFSIRWKLLLLFLYANAAPLSVLGFIAYDYLQNKKIALKNELNLEAARFLRDFDARFDQQRNHFDNSLNRVINRINKKNPGKLRESDLNQLKTELKRFNVSETYLFAKDGKKIFAHSSDGKDLSSSIKYFSTMAEGILKYMNRIILKTNKDDILSKITSPEDSEFIRNSIRDSRKIWPITIGDSVKLGYWNYLGNPEKFENNYYLLLMWSQDEFQKIYLRNHLDDLKKGLPDSLAFAKSIRSGKYLKEPENNANQLRKFMNRVEEKKSICNGEITYKSEDYIAVGMVGNNLNGMVLCTLFPSKEIEKKIGRTRNQFFAGALLSVVLTTLIGLMVARQFMTPVKKLSEAALQINQQNFRHRIEGMDQDEFGHLGEVVNRVIEGLGELEIAKVVQESLFPEESFSQPPFSVYGKSVVMTTLGGDYFDFFKIDDENFGVIIGDVAGHGVAAALIMAMAKARVRMTEKQQRLDPAGLVSLVHSIIHSLKSRNLRRMMTFQYLVLNSKTGKVTFTNAGHCFPLLVNRKNKSARFIEHIGSPLGAGRKARYENLEFSMTEGEALVLFTDGIIEARNKHGEMMGFEGFIDIVVKNYTENPEEYYKKIFAAYIAWAGEADDDTTMIVISRN